MEFNLVSNLDQNFQVEKFNAYNHVIAYSLRRALLDLDHEVNLVRDHGNEISLADHTIVISNVAMMKVRSDPSYKAFLRKATRGTLALWLDAAFTGWDIHFDRILNVVPPYPDSSPKYVWVGYAADPELFYPAQKRKKTVFVDSYMWGWYRGQFNSVYKTIQEILESSKLRVLQLVPVYNKGRRATWQEMMKAFRASHFHICTQIGNFGLTNIEASTCGALLVIHEDLNEVKSWPFKMDHVTWRTGEDLAAILANKPDTEAIRENAIENTWGKVVARVLEALE